MLPARLLKLWEHQEGHEECRDHICRNSRLVASYLYELPCRYSGIFNQDIETI